MEEFSDIPESLRSGLKAASPKLSIPAERDAAIKSAARPLLRRRLAVWRSTSMIGAIAAAIAIAVLVLASHDWSGRSNGKPVVAEKMPNDMNGDGAVDIRDALLVAQQTREGKTIPAPWNPSITLSAADVKSIASQIVTLPPSGNASVSGAFDHPLATLEISGERVTR